MENCATCSGPYACLLLQYQYTEVGLQNSEGSPSKINFRNYCDPADLIENQVVAEHDYMLMWSMT